MSKLKTKAEETKAVVDAEWHRLRRGVREEINDGRRIICGLREEVCDLREEVSRLRLENERLRLALPKEEEPKPKPEEHPTYKTYENLSIGDVLIHEETKYMIIATPTSKNPGRHLLNERWSVACIENSRFKRVGTIYQAGDNDFRKVELVDYSIIETGEVKKVKTVSPGEMFIHADHEVVYMVCEKNSTTLVVTFDGRAALIASELSMDDSVSMVKLETRRRGGRGENPF